MAARRGRGRRGRRARLGPAHAPFFSTGAGHPSTAPAHTARHESSIRHVTKPSPHSSGRRSGIIELKEKLSRFPRCRDHEVHSWQAPPHVTSVHRRSWWQVSLIRSPDPLEQAATRRRRLRAHSGHKAWRIATAHRVGDRTKPGERRSSADGGRPRRRCSVAGVRVRGGGRDTNRADD